MKLAKSQDIVNEVFSQGPRSTNVIGLGNKKNGPRRGRKELRCILT